MEGYASLPPALALAGDRTAAEALSRSAARCVNADRAILCRALGRYNLYLDPRDSSMTPFLAFDGFWEMWLTIAVAQHVRPGSICVDVGANVGYYTALMADLAGPRGAVFALEPQPATRLLLERTALANGPGGTVKVVACAAGNEDGQSRIGMHPHNCGGASVGGLQPDSTVWADCRVARLDSLVKGRVDVIKIDAEGMDFDVLRGAERVLSENSPVVFAEYIPDKWGHDEPGLRFMESLGYLLYEVDGAGQLRRMPIDDALRENSYRNLAWRAT